jgi:aminoglycoside 3-N-acetyltransferase
MDEEFRDRTPITRAELVDQIRALGVRTGGVLMVHCALSSLGFVVGGADTVVLALLEVVGDGGTLMSLAGWEHDSYELDKWPEPVRQAYLKDPPGFDPAVSEAGREFGRLSERIRTWPGAQRSNHPESSFTAIGPRARWLTSDQPWHHPQGPSSPLAKFVDLDGEVLMLGAPLETLTILHYAEELANVATKNHVVYTAPMKVGNDIEWRDVHDIETSAIGAFNYHEVVPDDVDAFEVIGRAALESGVGHRGKIGESESHLFPAPALVRFGVEWMERHFG